MPVVYFKECVSGCVVLHMVKMTFDRTINLLAFVACTFYILRIFSIIVRLNCYCVVLCIFQILHYHIRLLLVGRFCICVVISPDKTGC